MCAKYGGSNIKTVTWAQKVNFRQKYKESERKNTFSPLTQKSIKISKTKILFLEFHATTLHAEFHDCSLIGVTCSDGTQK